MVYQRTSIRKVWSFCAPQTAEGETKSNIYFKFSDWGLVVLFQQEGSFQFVHLTTRCSICDTTDISTKHVITLKYAVGTLLNRKCIQPRTSRYKYCRVFSWAQVLTTNVSDAIWPFKKVYDTAIANPQLSCNLTPFSKAHFCFLIHNTLRNKMTIRKL